MGKRAHLLFDRSIERNRVTAYLVALRCPNLFKTALYVDDIARIQDQIGVLFFLNVPRVFLSILTSVTTFSDEFIATLSRSLLLLLYAYLSTL